MSMDWDKLRIFKAVADAGSFTRAEAELGLSQSAISRQISTLEKSLALPLFYRHPRGLVLTEQGEMLLNATNDVFDRLQRAQTQLTDSRALPEGPLTITTVEFIATTWLIPKIAGFKEKYPNIQITLLLDNRLYNLSQREADIGIRVQRGDHNDLIEKKLRTLHFAICASKKYLKKKGRPETIADLKNHTMIGFPQNVQTPFHMPNRVFKKLDIDITSNNVMFISSMDSRYTAVKNQVGIAVLPKYVADKDEDLEILFPDFEIPGIDMYFVYPQERRNSKRITVFRDFLLENV